MKNEIELSLTQIVSFLRSGLIVALSAGVLLAAAAYLFSERRTPDYRASATAYAAERGLDLGSFGLPQLNASTLHIDTYKAAASSDPVLRRALAILGAPDADQADIRGLRGRISIRTDERPRLLYATADSAVPQRAADEANAVIEALVEWDRNRAGSSIGRVVTTLEQQIVTLEQDVERLQRSSGAIAEQQLAARQTLLAQQQDRMNYALALQVSVSGLVEIVQPATVSNAPVGTSTLFNTVLAGLLGLAFGYGARFFWSALDTNVRDPEELVEVSGLPVLATFPKVRGRGKNMLREAASFLRANLLHLTRNDSPAVVLVTSPTSDQGKTTVAASLAESLARNGHRTLLVDGDLRNPSVAKYFQMRGYNHLTVVDAINRTENMRSASSIEVGGDTRLSVLPGGKAMPQAAEFLGSSFEHALDRWRAGYQAIVIDSPPALAVADSLIMARHCTGVLVVVNAESSDRKQVRQTIDLLSRSENRLLGIVATHVDSRAVVSYGYPAAPGRSVLGGSRINVSGSPGEPAP